jgi:hypothetical protein
MAKIEEIQIKINVDTKKAKKKIKQLAEELNGIYDFKQNIWGHLFDMLLMLFILCDLIMGIILFDTIRGLYIFNLAIITMLLFNNRLRKYL